jgi:hypothetical protein
LRSSILGICFWEIAFILVFKIEGIESAAYWDMISPCGPWPSKTAKSQLKCLVPSGKLLITLNES